jgi:UDP-glucose 4-epimerase
VSGEVFNVGCGQSTSVNEVVGHIRQISNSQGEISYGPSRTGDVPRSMADISQAREKLGYRPQVLLREGLEHVALWFSKGGK